MKKLLTILVIVLVSTTTNAQNCNKPDCTYSTVLTYNPDQGYINSFNNATSKDVTCFDGNSSLNRITTAMSLNGIQVMIFNSNDARYECLAPINMQNKGKIYVEAGADLTINQLSMNGKDTIFLKGKLNILSVQHINNSTANNKAVIMMSPGSELQINGIFYSPGSTYQGGGNTSNQIYILSGCIIGGTLPVKFVDIQVKLITKNL